MRPPAGSTTMFEHEGERTGSGGKQEGLDATHLEPQVCFFFLYCFYFTKADFKLQVHVRLSPRVQQYI